jgi:acetoin utilization deacetylase AcuC-like enzyme
MGFCLFNHVAVGVRHALASHALERVAIVDFDVHHGNGTEEILRDEPRVLLCSSFRHPFYPHSGSQPHPGFIPAPLPQVPTAQRFALPSANCSCPHWKLSGRS